MRIFLDTANISQIEKMKDLGLVDGVTTNPTLIARENERPESLVRKISCLVKGPVNVEVTGTGWQEIVEEGKVIATWGEEIVIKVPITLDGLKAVKVLSELGIKTNVTLVFSPGQAILAAKAGATYVCPFVGRLDDISFNGIELIRQIKQIYTQFREFNTKIIAASIRHPMHVVDAALIGADVVTIPPTVVEQMARHPLTERGISQFLEDARKIGQGG